VVARCKEIAYTAKDQGRSEAWTTDVNLYTVSSGGGTPSVITATNKGADQNPVYSPDGRFIAYASQARAGFESDRFRLMVYDRTGKSSRELLPAWDRNADVYMWAPDMSALYVQTTDAARDKLFRVAFERGTAGSSLLKATAPPRSSPTTTTPRSRCRRMARPSCGRATQRKIPRRSTPRQSRQRARSPRTPSRTRTARW